MKILFSRPYSESVKHVCSNALDHDISNTSPSVS